MHYKNILMDAFSAIPFNQLLGITFFIENDEIMLRFKMQQNLIGNFIQGILHGGVISSVLDMAGGAAALFAFAQKHTELSIEALHKELSKASTIHLNIDYLRPGKGEEFFAKSTVIRTGNKITVTRMELFNENNEMIATASGTYFI